MKVKAVLIAALSVLCLTACGNSDSSSGAEGIVTIQTTTAPADSSSAAETTTASTTTAATTKETTKATTKETKKTTKATTKATTKETTKQTTEEQTTAQQTVTQAPPVTTEQQTQAQTVNTTVATTKAPEPAGPDLSTFKGKAMVNYKGFIFGVGENINDIKSKLGKESAPMSEAPNCLTGETSPIYFYEGMEIETTYAGKIFSIRMGSTVMYPGSDVATASGVKFGDPESKLTSTFGDPAESDAYGMKLFKEGSLTVTTFAFDGIVDTIQITDSSANS